MDPRASRLAADLATAKERDALRDEVARLKEEKKQDADALRALRESTATTPPPPPPPDSRPAAEVERRCAARAPAPLDFLARRS